MDINELRTGNAAENKQMTDQQPTGGAAVVDPNLQKNPPKKQAGHAPQRKIDPVKEYGLKSQDELDRENPDLRVPEDKIYDDLDKMVERENQKFENFNDVYEQSEGQLTYDDYVDMNDGFDPVDMLKNPPKPGHITMSEEQRKSLQAAKERERLERESDAAMAEENIRSFPQQPATHNAPAQEEITYENDEVDEDAELEKEIMEAIPDEADMMEETPNEHPAPASYYQVPESEQIQQKVEMPTKDDLDNPVNNSNVLEDIPDTQMNAEGRSEDDDLKALDDDTEESTEDEITKRRLELLREGVRSKVHPITKKFDISTMKISEKPVSVNNTLTKQRKSVGSVKTGDWVLPGSKRPVTMTKFKGSELELLVNDRRNRNQLNAIREQYTALYDHIVGPYKPADVEAWAKCTAVTDIDHLYACAYIASFEGINFLPYDCPNDKCNHSFVTDSVPFMDMVKFKDDKTKNQMMNLLNQQPTKANARFESEIVPISDVFAFGIHMPSIYDVVFVNAMLDDDFRTKYRDVIPVAPYISGMYEIEAENGLIRPLYIKEYRDNIIKTTKAKIITLAKVIKELTSDQYSMLRIYTNEITGDENQPFTYRMPAVTCPKCKTEIPESEYSASQLLFLRHHLASLANG